MSGDLLRLSYARVRDFQSCPRLYHYRHVEERRVPEDITPAGLVGQGLHRAMKELCDANDPRAGSAALDSYLKMPGHECAGPGTPHYDTALTLYARGVAAHNSIEAAASSTEYDSSMVWKQRGISVWARVDRIDRLRNGQLQIIDWKTGKRDFDEQVDQQLDIYHVVVRRGRQVPAGEAVRVISWNLRTEQQRVRLLEREHANGTMLRLAGIADQLRATVEFEPTPGAACRFCPWKPECGFGEESGGPDWDEYDEE